MEILNLDQIKKVLPSIDLVPIIESGFVAYSEGKATVPPVGELLMSRGETHVKYGFIEGGDYYVIKIASGFYGNKEIGLPSGNGMMLLFSQETGETNCILLDEAYLTDTRTAVAGAIAAKYLAPTHVERIGIVGTGIQARMQLEFLTSLIECRNVLVSGRGEEQVTSYKSDMEAHGFNIETTFDASDIPKSCNLIVTTTPSTDPLLFADDIREGTHITAIGSDTPLKQELDSAIIKKADLVVTDSIPQCLLRGEIYRAIEVNDIERGDLIELGNIILKKHDGRTSDDQITVADLTGVAVQDIKIAGAVYEAFMESN